jgi:hypothetical protein
MRLTGSCSRVLLIPLAMIAVAGCSQSATDDQSSAVLPAELSSEDKRALLLAEQQLVSECMRKEGFQYRVIPPPPGDTEVKPAFGTDDVAKARRQGYGIDSARADQTHGPHLPNQDGPPQDPNAVYVQSLSEAEGQEFDAALWGPSGSPQGSVTLPSGMQIGFPLKGCYSAARRRIYGEDLNRFMTVSTFVENLEGEITRRVRGDDRLIDRLTAWRACMRTRGYRFRDPSEAVEAATVQTDRQQAIAVADATCARDNHLVDVGRRLLKKYRREVFSEFDGRIITYNELIEAGVRQAEDVLRS